MSRTDSLIAAPTPLVTASGPGFAFYLKRDDLLAPWVGCSKMRFLSALHPVIRAEGHDALLFLASAGSSLVASAACACNAWGIQCHALVQPQADTPGARAAIAAGLAFGCRYELMTHGGSLRMATSEPQRALARLRSSGLSVLVIPFGGDHPQARVAYVEAGLELARGLDALPDATRPSRVYLACASGRLTAGIATGLAVWNQARQDAMRVMAVAVSPAAPMTREAFAPMVDAMLASARTVCAGGLPQPETVLATIEPVDGLFGGGYGEAVPEAMAAASWFERAVGIRPDETYTSKALAVMLSREREEFRALLWLSGGIQRPSEREIDERDADRLLVRQQTAGNGR